MLQKCKSTLTTPEMNYDTWKLDCPPDMSDVNFYDRAVNGRHSIFAWQVFCNVESEFSADHEAWETCKKGPFTTVIAKLTFLFHLLVFTLQGVKNPVRAAGIAAGEMVSDSYLDACEKVQETWRAPLTFCKLCAIQDDDDSISLYRCEFEEAE